MIVFLAIQKHLRKMENKTIYTPVPTILLHGFLDDKKRRGVINDIIDYAIYYHAERLGGNYHRAHEILCIKSSNEEANYKNGKKIAGKVTSKSFYELDVNSLFKIRDNSHTQKFLENFLMYHALRSMQGVKMYYRGTNLFVASRMDGHDCKVADVCELSPEIAKICTRRRMETKREELNAKYGVSFYYPKNLHGFYYSTRLNLDELIEMVITKNERKKKSGVRLAELSRNKETEILEKLRKRNE